jgi:hypothetical protein
MSPNAGGGGCGVSAKEYIKEYSCAHGAQINVGDLTPYLTPRPKDRRCDQWLQNALKLRAGQVEGQTHGQ